jgi:methylase of polypeptide subunit release factors
MTQRDTHALQELFARLAQAGFDESNVARWFGVPTVTDARWAAAPASRVRRGLGAWIALWVAGEAVSLQALVPRPSAEERAALVAARLVAEEGEQLRPRARVMPWRGLVVASPPGEQFDVSAVNVAACLPAARSVWDVGCGAGLLALAAARAGAERVVASDVDAELVGWTRLNAALAGATAVQAATGDLLDVAEIEAGRRFALVVFNAPLLRAPLAVAGGDEARYVASPRGEALATAFLRGVGARLEPGGRVLLHAQLTAGVEAALGEWAERARVASVVFAHAPDGTAHALTEIDCGALAAVATTAATATGSVAAGRGWRRVYVPLSGACRHLTREILDAAKAEPAAAAARVRPAPWLELRTSERFDRDGRRVLERRFGGVVVDAADVALLERLAGGGDAGDDQPARDRVAELAGRNLVIAD